MKTILITGGTGLLGTAVVPRLAADYRCVVMYHGEKGWNALRKIAPQAEGVQADVSDESGIAAALAGIDEIYAVVHLVGGFDSGTITSDAEAWTKMMSLNLFSAVNVLRAAVPKMTKGGRLIAMSSQASIEKPTGLTPYVVSKSALNALMQTLAVELQPRAITANVLAPSAMGPVGSGLVSVDRVADTIAFLLSGGGSNITGAIIPLAPQ